MTEPNTSGWYEDDGISLRDTLCSFFRNLWDPCWGVRRPVQKPIHLRPFSSGHGQRASIPKPTIFTDREVGYPYLLPSSPIYVGIQEGHLQLLSIYYTDRPEPETGWYYVWDATNEQACFLSPDGSTVRDLSMESSPFAF